MAGLYLRSDVLDNMYKAIECFSDVNKRPVLSKKRNVKLI